MVLPDSPPDQPCLTQTGIDAAVEAGEGHGQDLETIRLLNLRNALQPAVCLPDDILAAIFMRFRDDVITEERHTAMPASHEWIKLGSICHHWRKVFLCYSLLWTEISVTSSAWLDLLSVRSGTAPLHISLPWIDVQLFTLSSIQIFQTLADRVESLEIYISASHIWGNPTEVMEGLYPSITPVRQLRAIKSFTSKFGLMATGLC